MSIARPALQDVELPSLRRIERYCVAVTMCPVTFFGPKGQPGANAIARCVRDVVDTLARTTLLDHSLEWLDDGGRATKDCGLLLGCRVGGVDVTRCLGRVGQPARCTLVGDPKNGPAAPNVIMRCPSPFLPVPTNCSETGQSCRDRPAGAWCTKREKCGPDSVAWSCRGNDRVRCEDGYVMIDPCEDDRTCSEVSGVATCISTAAPCPAAPSCTGDVGEVCVDGARRRIACRNGWQCDPEHATDALPCTISSTPSCDASLRAHCVGDEIEYCAFGSLRRISCAQLVGTTCVDPPGTGALCAGP